PPELARIEVVHVPAAKIVQVLATDGRCPLERILTDVHDGWHVGRRFLSRPAIWLLEELELEVVDAKGAQMGSAEVEDLATSGGPLAAQQIHLVVAVEVVLVAAVPELHPFQELVLDVRVAGRRCEGGKPIEAREDAVLDGSRLDHARPADDAW